MMEKTDYDVRVFCPKCKAGNNSIWKGGLINWGLEMSKETPPAWAQYAKNHESAHGHTIMVEYPDKTVPLFDSLGLRSGVHKIGQNR